MGGAFIVFVICCLRWTLFLVLVYAFSSHSALEDRAPDAMLRLSPVASLLTNTSKGGDLCINDGVACGAILCMLILFSGDDSYVKSGAGISI
jgi:hypothetical protein